MRNITGMVLAGALLFPAAVRADTVYLKNGNAISGIVKNDDDNGVTLEINIGTVKFGRKEIDRVEKTTSSSDANGLRQQWESARQLEEDARRVAEETRPRTETVSVDKQTGHVVVAALINGKVSAKLIVDTGATMVVLSKKVGDQLGGASTGAPADGKPPAKRTVELTLGDGRKAQADYVLLKTVAIEDSSATNIDAAVLSDENATPGYDGVLGMSFLSRFNIGINQKEGKLTLEKLKP